MLTACRIRLLRIVRPIMRTCSVSSKAASFPRETSTGTLPNRVFRRKTFNLWGSAFGSDVKVDRMSVLTKCRLRHLRCQKAHLPNSAIQLGFPLRTHDPLRMFPYSRFKGMGNSQTPVARSFSGYSYVTRSVGYLELPINTPRTASMWSHRVPVSTTIK